MFVHFVLHLHCVKCSVMGYELNVLWKNCFVNVQQQISFLPAVIAEHSVTDDLVSQL